MAQPQAVPPDDDYRTLRTEHFRVTFPSQLEELGRRASLGAERAHATLEATFLPPPAGPIDLLVLDHSDFSNGFAEVFPSNRLVVFAQPPLDGLAISHFDAWLETVILHELVHLFHLDRSGPLGRGVRSVLGRVPWTWPAYPGYAASFLGIEGIAVHRESLHTRAGRVHGSFHGAIARTQVLGRGSETVGQGLGRSPLWPGGDRPYVFGSLLFRYLSDTYGEPALVGFLTAVADQWVPYRLDAAARQAFGRSFQELWGDWIAEVEAESRSLQLRIESGKELPPTELLTRGGRYALHPAPSPSGRSVAYVRADGRSDAAIVVLADGEETALARWNSLDRPRWLDDESLLLSQAEFFDTYRIYKDLFRLGLDGEVRRLTRGLRVLHLDAHPGTGRVVAVLGGAGSNRLALLDSDGAVLTVLREADVGVLWSHPAWSPDGRRIAVARRRPGGWTAIVIFDAATGGTFEIVEDRSLNSSPTWSPDGSLVLWASDRSGVSNLYAAEVAAEVFEEGAGEPRLWQVTDLATAGTFPSVDRSGEWIYLSVLSDDGWEIGRIPFDRASWFDPLPIDPRYDPALSPAPLLAGQSDSDPSISAEIRPYSALPTLVPRYWLPIRAEAQSTLGRELLPQAWGVRTSGSDLLGRHEYDVRVLHSLGSARSRPEWRAGYSWAGLGNPVIVGETGQEWTARGAVVLLSDPAQNAAPDTLLPFLRERWVGGSVQLRRQRMRSAGVVSFGTRIISQRRRLLDLEGTESASPGLLRPSRTLAEARLTARLSTTRSYPFSVSTENGVGVSLELRQRWDRSVPDSLVGRAGADGAFREAVVSLRGYRAVPLPGFANHVLSLRAAVGVADGPGTGTGHFSVGGGGGDGRGLLGFTLGSAFRRFPVRGLPPGARRGDKAWSASGEWRFPVAMIHRGLGAWPIHIDRVAGSVFVDAAGTGRDIENAGARWRSVSSMGAEVVVFGSLLFDVDRVRFGVAVPLETAAGISRAASLYVETGWSF